MVVNCERLPKPGETVLGGTFFMNAGGKGANQAVAAARLGGHVTFVANVGDDLFGNQSIVHFKQEGINTEFVSIDSQYASGVALINVDQHGENNITVAPGSNGNLRPAQVEGALKAIRSSGIILIQLEIPIATVTFAVLQSNVNGHKVILNPAPAQKLNESIYKNLFLITPNESEAELLTGIPVKDLHSAESAARKFQEFGVLNVIITMGAKGAYLLSGPLTKLIPAPPSIAVDSTAAGDCFNGALAVKLSEGTSLEEAVSFAVRAASLSVTRKGAQASMPYRKELLD
jgi:ribokinase